VLVRPALRYSLIRPVILPSRGLCFLGSFVDEGDNEVCSVLSGPDDVGVRLVAASGPVAGGLGVFAELLEADSGAIAGQAWLSA
jgi:hypothetical protein